MYLSLRKQTSCDVDCKEGWLFLYYEWFCMSKIWYNLVIYYITLYVLIELIYGENLFFLKTIYPYFTRIRLCEWTKMHYSITIGIRAYSCYSVDYLNMICVINIYCIRFFLVSL